MEKLGVWGQLQPRIVMGENLGQTMGFIESGNAELGFVALSQIIFVKDGSRWAVPAGLYTPIEQDAVLLKVGTDNAAAKAFLAFLRGPEARVVIEKYGYGTGR